LPESIAVILAAGKGTRMNSDLPKVLHEVCGRPMLAYVLEACRRAGCSRLITVIGHEADRVRRTFEELDHDVDWAEQTEQLGTGHAVRCAAGRFAGHVGEVLVVAGDGPLLRAETLRKLLATHRAERAACTLATSVLPEPGRYGRILRGEGGELLGIVEYLDATDEQRRIREVNVSLYCFDAQALREALPRLTNRNAKKEYYLTDVLGLLRADGAKLAAVPAVPPEEVLGINTPEELEQVNRIMAGRLAERTTP